MHTEIFVAIVIWYCRGTDDYLREKELLFRILLFKENILKGIHHFNQADYLHRMFLQAQINVRRDNFPGIRLILTASCITFNLMEKIFCQGSLIATSKQLNPKSNRCSKRLELCMTTSEIKVISWLSHRTWCPKTFEWKGEIYWDVVSFLVYCLWWRYMVCTGAAANVGLLYVERSRTSHRIFCDCVACWSLPVVDFLFITTFLINPCQTSLMMVNTWFLSFFIWMLIKWN